MASNADSLPVVGSRTYAHHIAEVVEETVVVVKKPKKSNEAGEPENAPEIEFKTTRAIRIDGQVLPQKGALRFITLDWCARCLNGLASDPDKRCTYIKGVQRTKCDNCSAAHTGTSAPCNLPVVELQPIGSSMVIEALKLGDIKFEILKLKSSTVPGAETVIDLRALEIKHKKTEEMYKNACKQWKQIKSDLNKKAKKSNEQGQTADKGKDAVEGKNIEAKDNSAGAQTEGGKSKEPSASDKFAVYLHPTHAAAPFVQRGGPQGVLTAGERLTQFLVEVRHALSQFNSLIQTRPLLDSEETRKLQLEYQRVTESMKEYNTIAIQMCSAPNGQVRPASMDQSSSAPNDQVYPASMGQSSPARKRETSSTRKRKGSFARKGQGSSAPNGQVLPASMDQSSSALNDQAYPASMCPISSANDIQMGGTLNEEMPDNSEKGLDLEMVDVDINQTPLPEFVYQQHNAGNGQWPIIGAGPQQFGLNMGQQSVLGADSEQIGLTMHQQAGPNMHQQTDPNMELLSFSNADYMQPEADMGYYFN